MAKKVSMNVEATNEVPKDHLVFKEEGYGERHFVRNGVGYLEVTKPLREPVRVHSDRRYVMRDALSFTAYVEKYGDHGEGIICADQTQMLVTMYFRESSRDESVALPFKSSLELLSFLGSSRGLRAFGQKDLVKTLETFPDVVKDSKLILPNIERLKIETAVNFESNTNERDYTFIYKEKEGNQTSRIPKQLTLTLPYFEGSKRMNTILVDLDIERPKSAEEKPLFRLIDPRVERTLRDAFEVEIADIRKALPKWQFVWGKL